MANTGRLGQASFKKETTWGTYETPTQGLSITSEGLATKVDTVEDQRFMGKVFPSDFIKVGETIDGALNVTAHPTEIGPIVYWALGKQVASATAPRAFIMIAYTGADAYADVVKTAGTIVGSSGATVGTKSGAWTFDTTAAGYDTLIELVTAIDAVSGWNAYAFGMQTAPTAAATWADFSLVVVKTGDFSNSYIGRILSASTTTKLHAIYPGGATDTEIPWSICIDRTLGTNAAFGLTGAKCSQLQFKVSAKQIVEMTMNVSAKVEATGQTYPSVTPASDYAYVAGNARLFQNGTEATVAKDFTIDINNNLDKSNIVGSLYIMEQIRNGASAKIAGTLNLVTANWATPYAAYKANSPQEFIVYLENAGYGDTTNNVKHCVLIKINAAKLTKYDTMLSGPNRITTSFEANVMTETGYNNIDIYVVDTATSDY